MNTAMTCNATVLNPVRANLSACFMNLRRFLSAMLETKRETACGLTADMAARLYL